MTFTDIHRRRRSVCSLLFILAWIMPFWFGFVPMVSAQQSPIPNAVDFNILKPSTTGIPGEEVRVMTLDREGNLWIAGRWPFWWECAVAMLDPHEQEFVALPGGGFDTGKWQVWSNIDHPIPSVFIDSIRFTQDNVAWIGSEGGLTRFDRHASTPQEMWKTWNTTNSPLIHDGVRSISVDAQGNLWILNRVVNYVTGGIFKFNPSTETWTHYPIQGGNWDYTPVGMTLGNDGMIYVTHEFASGFSKLNPATGIWTYQPGGTGFGGIMQDQQGNLWLSGGIGSEGGLWKWNGSSFQSWPMEVTGLSSGLDGTVYVSTWYGPIYRMLNGNTPQFFVDAQGLPRAVIERPNGDFFINNYGSTLALGRVRQYNRFGQLLRRMNTYNCGLPDYFMGRIQRDRMGHTWFSCGEGGLTRMEGSDGSQPTRWRNFGNHNDQSEPYPWAGNEPMYGIHHDEVDGMIWMGGNGVGRWNPATGQFADFWNWQNSSLGAVAHTGFARDRNGDMWVATDMYGIMRLNTQSNNWESKQFGQGTANEIAGLVRDTDGNLWVATRTMLHFFNGTTWFAIGIWHGSPVEWPTALAADPNGGVWIGASNGLIHYRDGVWTHYHSGNSLMPVDHVASLDVREDGLVAITAIDYEAPIPFPGGVCLFNGEEWRVFKYGQHPFPHHQLGHLSFDADGDVWVSCMSEGVTEIVLESPKPKRPGDVNSDGVVNVTDLLAVIQAWGTCPAPPSTCPADVAPAANGDGLVNVADLLMVISHWG